ncbi:polysaccharide biosynthesis C-terminal domain-containing protein [Fluviicola sp.]|jgi:O-antigen/teichoic acid export membrane protein|uniref:lipopolysaccharide biosynthesis protein n=1 Tax=Fluviicola sp. TaxID=1917219 RepID=UPI002834D294|nr:polysaccharide biosynthesis C-terminal domain-containing protein [Fluviicola sp.]MDR0801807.1 polysaccharide biosynthesis C-terminal domain-containing protein [Fluviicola sp.]
MGLVQKDAFRTTVISYLGILLGYLNKGVLFLLILSTAQIGLVNLIISIGTLFAQLANFGTVFATWKFFPFMRNQSKNHHGFLTFILLFVGAGILLYTIIYVVFREQIQAGYIEKSPMFIDYYYWTLPIGIAYVVFMVLEIYLRSLYKNIVAVFAYEIVLRFATTVVLVFKWMDLISFDVFVILHSLLYLIPTLILIIYLRRMNEFNIGLSQIKISKRFKKIVFYYSSYSYLNTLGAVWVNSLDVLMIAQLVGLTGTGIFTTVVFLSSALQVPYKSIIRVSSPLVSDYWKHRQMDKMKELYVKTSSVSLVLGLGMFILVWVNIDFLFSFLKPEFREGIWVFFFIMIGRLVDMYFGLNGAIFTTSKKYRYDIFFTVFLMIAVYVLNAVMIPVWGIVGAGISTTIAILVYSFGRLIFIWVVYKLHPFNLNQFIIIGLGLITLAIGHFTQGMIGNKWIQFIVESLLSAGCFFLPIYFFSLEPEVVNYMKKGTRFLFKGK